MNTNIRKMVRTGEFPTTRTAAIELIDRINALREIEVIRKEEENEKKNIKIHAQSIYIKPVFNDTHTRYDNNGRVVGSFTCKKTGPTIWKEVILAFDKQEADKYLQRMVEKGVAAAKVTKAENMMVMGWHKLKELMATLNEEYVKSPIVGFRTFRRKGYKILRRTYLKPPVHKLAKAEVNFF